MTTETEKPKTKAGKYVKGEDGKFHFVPAAKPKKKKKAKKMKISFSF